MRIEEQMLSLEQGYELEKLGFLNSRTTILSLMTVGNIISLLPAKIKKDYFLSVNPEYCAYSMVGGIDTIFITREKKLIDNLFNTLIWCIKNKYI